MANTEQIIADLQAVVALQAAESENIGRLATAQTGVADDVAKLLAIVAGSGTPDEKLEQIATLASGLLAVTQSQAGQLQAVADALSATDAQYPPSRG